MVNEERPIKTIWYAEEGSRHEVGSNGVTRIVAYHECGGNGPDLWFAVCGDDGTARIRVRASSIESVVYE